MMKDLEWLQSVVVIGLCLFLGGCAAIGPHTIARERFDYTSAISNSWKAQMLINMIKLRYGDAPTFLKVASVINQYSLEGQVNVAFSWEDPVTASVPNMQSAGAAGRYTDRPTITYSPLTGEKFARSLMTPIPPPAILSLIQANYSVDLILGLCVHSMNGLRNGFGGEGRTRVADPEFLELLRRLGGLQSYGVVGFRIMKTNGGEATLLTLRDKVGEQAEQDIRAVRNLLGLDPVEKGFSVVYASIARNNRELAILSRSILEIIVDLASHIEVPQEHVEEKRVNPTLPREATLSGSSIPWIRILSSREKPSDAFVAAPYHDYWFYIDDRDLPSKRLFSSLMFVFTLVETSGKNEAPVVTIPAG